MTDITPDAAQDEPDIFELFESDPEAEKEGVKLTIGKSWFRIRSVDSEPMRKVRSRQIVSQMKAVQANRGIVPEALQEKNNIELACTAVTDWGDVPHPGIEERKQGLMLAYSAANAKLLFANPKLRGLRDWVLSQAQTFENFKAATAEVLEGNSATASDGSSSTAETPPA